MMDCSLSYVNRQLSALQNKFSLKVSVRQNQMEIYLDHEYSKIILENSGFINSHLCLNAQTVVDHTEQDSSYTVITVSK